MITRNRKVVSLVVIALLGISTSYGAIDEPTSEDVPIRLSTRKPLTKSNKWELHEPPEVLEEQAKYRPPPGTAYQGGQHHVSSSVRLQIVDPPNKSYIAGTHFIVKLKVHVPPSVEKSFQKAYERDGHACLSLDDGPYHCWNFENAQMFFAQATDGEHTLTAKLYRDGSLQHETTSEQISFTVVHNPEFEDGANFHKQTMTVKRRDVEDEEDDGEEGEAVEVAYPTVQIINPEDRVSYSGTRVGLKTLLVPEPPKLFRKYFQHGFTCFNVDFATAHACYPLFQNNTNPFILGLDIGMHSIEALLINPQTGDLLKGSSRGRKIFFMAGESNEGAHFVANINVRGKLHKVPMVQGGSIIEQAKSLCSSVGLVESIDCIEPVSEHIKLVADQNGFF